MSKKVTVQMLSNCQYRKTGPKRRLFHITPRGSQMMPHNMGKGQGQTVFPHQIAYNKGSYKKVNNLLYLHVHVAQSQALSSPVTSFVSTLWQFCIQHVPFCVKRWPFFPWDTNAYGLFIYSTKACLRGKTPPRLGHFAPASEVAGGHTLPF
jgi:hypothetical protein